MYARTALLFDTSRSALLLRVGPSRRTDLGTDRPPPPNAMPTKELLTEGQGEEAVTWGS